MTFFNKISKEKCRLCQEKAGIHDIKDNQEYVEKIFQCVNFRINDTLKAYLPHSICKYCKKKIKDIHTYLLKVQRVNERLRQTVLEGFSSNCKDEEYPKDQKTINCEFCNQKFVEDILYNIHVTEHQCPTCLRLGIIDGVKKTTLKNESDLHCKDFEAACTEKSLLDIHKCPLEEIGDRSNENIDEINIGSKNFEDIDNQDEVNKSAEEKSIKTKVKKKTKRKIKSIYTEISDNTTEDCSDSNKKDVLECLTCDKQFNNKKSLKLHKKSHKNFSCPKDDCAKTCPTSYSLKIHLLNHDGKRPYLCVTCGKSFLTKNSLNCHEKIHLDVKSYQCKSCDIGFSVRSNLRAHEKKYHEGIRFYCSQCTKQFLTKCSLDRHEKVHSGIKEFKCEDCMAAFYTSKELVKHQRYHQGVKRHKCEECFKSFFERHHLVIHMRGHSGERPYKCKLPGCEKSFVDNQKLKRHQSTRHNNLSVQ